MCGCMCCARGRGCSFTSPRLRPCLPEAATLTAKVRRLLATLSPPRRASAGRAPPMEATSSVAARLLMHRLDVLLALSSSVADPEDPKPQWLAVSAAL